MVENKNGEPSMLYNLSPNSEFIVKDHYPQGLANIYISTSQTQGIQKPDLNWVVWLPTHYNESLYVRLSLLLQPHHRWA